jgi:hypothetical protein
MGYHDEYCVICAGPYHNTITNDDLNSDEKFNDQVTDQITENDFRWLNNLLIITDENEIIEKVGSYSDYGSFKTDEHGMCFTTPSLWYSEFADSRGLLCHHDCYKTLQNEFKFDLKFKHLSHKLSYPYYESVCVLKDPDKKIYGLMNKYSRKQMSDMRDVEKEDHWLFKSPLISDKNKNRICAGWSEMIKPFKSFKSFKSFKGDK